MILYKYVSPQRIDILQNGMIAYTKPLLFNDPFEASPVMDGIELEPEQMERVSKVEANRHGMSEEMRLEILERSKDPLFFRESLRLMRMAMGSWVGTLSLSETEDSLLMWAHYTDQHTGFVIGFDTEHPAWISLETSRGDIGSEVQAVTYATERLAPKSLGDLKPKEMFFFKSSEWTYEREWRITRFLQKADQIIEDRIFLFKFAREAVAKVILGCRCSDSLRDEIVAALGSLAYAGCKILRAVPDEKQFKLNIVPL